jgi:hypothetical protein
VLFSDLSSERIVRALKKAGFRVIHEGKHIGLSDGARHLTVPLGALAAGDAFHIVYQGRVEVRIKSNEPRDAAAVCEHAA